jgi:outer membrane biogenesis lipoprotein LolB
VAVKIIAWVLLLVLAACASVPDRADIAGREAARERYLSAQTEWAFSGRLAYSQDGKGGSAKIQWRQSGSVSDVRIDGPLASGSVRLRLEGDLARVFDASGRELKSGRPDVLLQDLLQMPMPPGDWVGGLRAYWATAPELTSAAAQGRVDLAEWSWRYEQWRDEPVRLPVKIEISRPGSRVRIVVDQWRGVAGE